MEINPTFLMTPDFRMYTKMFKLWFLSFIFCNLFWQPTPQGYQNTDFQTHDSFLFHYSYYQIPQIILNSQYSHYIFKSSFISIYLTALRGFFPQNTLPKNTVIISHPKIQFSPSVNENIWKTYPYFSPHFSNMLLITSVCFFGI